jgi:hypothetical protein
VLHRIRVPAAWFESGEVIEFELPRNLACAACEGGGCDTCQRAGAITLRGRDELAEILSVTLPRRNPDLQAEPCSVVIRIPEQGGLPPEHDDVLPRGLLLLRVEPAELADPGVTRVAPPAPRLSQRVMQSLHSLRIPESPRGRAWLLAVAAVMVVLAGVAIFAFRRHRGLS